MSHCTLACRLLAVWLLSGIAACGGGGGGGSSGPPPTYTVSGAITSAVTGGGVSQVTVTLSGASSATTSTDSSGRYSFSGLSNGAYTVAVTLSGAILTPASRSVTISNAAATGVDFSAIRGTTLVAGAALLPKIFSSFEQLRASLIVKNGDVIFSDSSDLPLKKLVKGGTTPTALSVRFRKAEGIALRGQYVYWIDGNRLSKTSLDGNTTVLATGTRTSGADGTTEIVVDDANVYWVDSECGQGCSWRIKRVSLAGGTPVTLATVARRVVALAGDTQRVYWEEASVEPVSAGCECGSSIKAVSKTGGSAVVLVDGFLNGSLPPVPPGHTPGSWQPTGGLAVTASEVFFGVSDGVAYQVRSVPLAGGSVRAVSSVPSDAGMSLSAIHNITVSGGNLYWIDPSSRSLDTVPAVGGTASIIATNLGGPGYYEKPGTLAISSTTAFWTEPGSAAGCCIRAATGSIKQIALAGGTVTTVTAGLDAPAALAVDAEIIVWSEEWRVGRVPRGGGTTVTLASGVASNMARIAADQSSVYILDGELIKKVPLAGGTIEKLAPANGGLVQDYSKSLLDITTDGANVYWTIKDVAGAPIVQKVPVSGGTVTVLASEGSVPYPQDCYRRIAVDAQNVYWSAGSTRYPVGCAIKSVSIAGGSVTTLVDYPYLADFAIDSTGIYFSELGSVDGSIQKVGLAGGSPTSVATPAAAFVLASDANGLYWVDVRQRTIMRITKSAGASSVYRFPLTLDMDPQQALEALTLDSSGVYYTETPVGDINYMY